jgi:hypothetical protein
MVQEILLSLVNRWFRLRHASYGFRELLFDINRRVAGSTTLAILCLHCDKG